MSWSSSWRRLGEYLGLLYPAGGQPRRDNHGRSRYDRGFLVSKRLDEDVDELRARMEALERRLDT